jgi:hypothetical protein
MGRTAAGPLGRFVSPLGIPFATSGPGQQPNIAFASRWDNFPPEAVCGANRLSANYASGLHVAVYGLGAGCFVLNNLLIRENLGRVPAARDLDQPPAELPADFEQQVTTWGY